jgi:CubicO group peptidase (beta-lactamase class C family)
VEALRQVDGWPVEQVAVGALRAGAEPWLHGDLRRPFTWKSVTKLATALAVLVAAEEGSVELDEAAGPPGSTVRHLLAHASGLPLDDGPPIAEPGARRIYSDPRRSYADYPTLYAQATLRQGQPAEYC